MTLTRVVFTIAACLGLALTSSLRADEYWNGGDGTWDFNNTGGWNAGTWSSNDQVAHFESTTGTITVDDSRGQVEPQYLLFGGYNQTTPWVVQSKTSADTLALSGNANYLIYQYGNQSADVKSNLTVDTTRSTDRYNIYQQNNSSLTLDGNITFGAQNGTPNSNRSLIIGSSSNDAVFYLNGSISDSYLTGGTQINVRFAEGGADRDTYYVNGDLSGAHGGIQVGSGNVVIDPTAVLPAGTVGMYDDQDNAAENVAVYAAQGATISDSFYISMKYHFNGSGAETPGAGTLGAWDASSVLYTGSVTLDNSGLILTAGTGATAEFSGGIQGHSPAGVIKTGAGTVVLSGSSGYGIQNDFSSSTVAGGTAFDIQQGTVIITNTTGSAFGGSNGVVKVENGTKLAGTGASSEKVVAGDVTSHISPGLDTTIGTLHLNGGLTAANGVSLDFKLSGVTSDTIDLGTSFMTLKGNITFNFTGTPTISVANGNGTYIIMTNVDFATTNSNSTDADHNPLYNFVFNAPAGYKVSDWGVNGGDTITVNGELVDAGHDSLYVQFAATPEPSTYGLMGLGLLALVVIRRFRRLNT